MPEKKFDGRCLDCGQEFTELSFEWDGLKANFGSPLVNWLTAHHADAPSNECNRVLLYSCGGTADIEAMIGWVMASRLQRNYLKRDNPMHWNITFKIFSSPS